jgi:biotin carboxyl carrier protein
MRRYAVDIGERTYVIDVQELARDRFRVAVDGQDLEVNLASAEDLPEAVITPGIAPRGAPGAPVAFKPPAPESLPPVRETPPPALPPLPQVGAPSAGIGLVTTPMPGTVLDVLVEAGERVERGDTLVKLEAMKMVNAIKAPHDGVVEEVLASPGQQVGYGAGLVRLAER